MTLDDYEAQQHRAQGLAFDRTERAFKREQEAENLRASPSRPMLPRSLSFDEWKRLLADTANTPRVQSTGRRCGRCGYVARWPEEPCYCEQAQLSP